MEQIRNSYQPSQYSEIRTFDDLVKLILTSLSSGVGDNERQSRYDLLQRHPYKPYIYELFQETKQNIVLGHCGNPERKDATDDATDHNVSELLRLDGMLLAKGIISPAESSYCQETVSYEPPIDNSEYLNLVQVLKTIYRSELAKYNQGRDSFCGAVHSLLTEQSILRPISTEEINTFVLKVKKYFLPIETQLKQQICETLLVFCSRTLDARRKRRNFNKDATDVLNEYFHHNLDNPYPDEETKGELSKRCRISVSQVSNWFGNKRIRFKKNALKHGPNYVSTNEPSPSQMYYSHESYDESHMSDYHQRGF